MAAFSTLVVTNNAPGGVTLTFNAAAVDLTAYQLKQLKAVVDKCVVQCSVGEIPTQTGATITLPAGM